MPSEAAARCAPSARRTPPEGDVERLYREHGQRCWRLARSIVRDPQLAEDVVQEVFLLHWRGDGFDPSRSSDRHWLLMLTHRKAVDRVRSEQLRTTSPLDAAPDREAGARGPEETAFAALLAPKVHAALSALPEVQRRVIVLAYWGGRTQREIAAITAVPLGTVKTRMRTGMLGMRGALRDEHLARC